MIRIQLVHEGRVVKQIRSRVHESVVLEQVKRYDKPIDEIRVVEGELSEGAKDILHHVAKKIVPAAMAAGIALAGASGAHAQNVGVPGQNRDFPGLEMSIGQHLGAIFSPNYQEIMRQRNYERQTQQQVWNAEQNEIRNARIQQARERGRAETGLPPTGSQNVRVYDQARTSNDGKYFIIYGMDNSITRIPTQGTEFMPGDSQRLPHYIAPSGQVFYVRHPAGTMTEGFAPIGTIPASGTGNNKPTGTGTPINHDDEELNGNTPNLGNATNTQQPTGKTTNLNIDANGEISLGDEEEPAGIKEASGRELIDIIMQHQSDVKRYTANQKADPAPELAQALSAHYGTEDFKPQFDKDLTAIFYQADQATRPQQESITEMDEGLKGILDQFPEAFKAFKEGDEIDDNQEFFDALFNYYSDSGEMPYGVQKARDGDPYQWIADRLDHESGSMSPVTEKQGVAEGAEFGAYYSEQLAQKVFDQNPNLDTNGKADAVLDAGWPLAVADLGKKRAQYEFGYNEDFPSDFVSAYSHLQKQSQGVAEGVNHSALQDWDEMTGDQKRDALVKAGITDRYSTLGKTPGQLDDMLHAARVKAQNQEDELSMGASGRRELQRQVQQDFEEQRRQLHKEKMEMEKFAWEKANTEAERKQELIKIDKEYTHELDVLRQTHSQDMQKILHADEHELVKLKAEFNMRKSDREHEFALHHQGAEQGITEEDEEDEEGNYGYDIKSEYMGNRDFELLIQNMRKPGSKPVQVFLRVLGVGEWSLSQYSLDSFQLKGGVKPVGIQNGVNGHHPMYQAIFNHFDLDPKMWKFLGEIYRHDSVQYDRDEDYQAAGWPGVPMPPQLQATDAGEYIDKHNDAEDQAQAAISAAMSASKRKPATEAFTIQRGDKFLVGGNSWVSREKVEQQKALLYRHKSMAQQVLNKIGKPGDKVVIIENEEEASTADQAQADLNIIVQLKKASDNEVPQPLRLANGEIKISRETARKILDKFNQLRPASKETMQHTLNSLEGFREILNYFNEREVDESVEELSKAMQPVREAELRARRLIKSVFGK